MNIKNIREQYAPNKEKFPHLYKHWMTYYSDQEILRYVAEFKKIDKKMNEAYK